jgi:hypothetical protein
MRLGLGALAAVTAFVAAFAVAGALWVPSRDGPVTNPLDFRAFYCAGAALGAGADPYRVEPLRACERSTLASAGLTMDPRRVVPAPLPPYALLAFAALARLPYRVASQAWFALTLLALSASIWLVAMLARLRPLPVAAALFAALGTASLAYGQVVPLAVAGLALAALAARERNGPLAAAGCCIAALEPHLALPVWLGLALLAPATRRSLAVAGTLLAALSLAAGAGLNLEYVTEVLPLHARSEIMEFGGQYGLPSLLWTLGTPIPAALAAGSLCYAVMLTLGLAIARGVVVRTGDAAFAVTIPAAAVLLGGPFLHDHQLAAALPLGLMLAGSVPAGSRAWTAAVMAVVLLAIPWQSLAEFSAGVDRLPPRAVGAAPADPPPARADQLAEVPYTAFVDAFADRDDRRTRFEQTLWKMPTWLALIALCGLAVRFEGRRRVRI